MITLSSRVLLAKRNKAPLGRKSGSNGAKSNFELRIKTLLSTPEALGTCPIDVRTPLFAWGAIFCVYRAYCACFERYMLGI
jgi:hypothetical protein